jgi:ribosome-associated protein
VIIASGTSNRQTKALAASVRSSVKGRGMEVMSTEGEDNGEWIIVDCGAAVAHIMQPAIREYYHLEEIWGGKSVKMKLGAVDTKLVKASEPTPTKPAATRTAVKTVAKKASAKKVVAKRAADQAAAYKRVAAKKAPARKTVAAKKAPVRKGTFRA